MFVCIFNCKCCCCSDSFPDHSNAQISQAALCKLCTGTASIAACSPAHGKSCLLSSARGPLVHVTSAQCRDLHFTEQVTPLTDFSLGDCSYLNTCHREGCKFVHYKTPRVPVIKQEPPRDAVARYLNVDIRQLNIQRLGKFSVIICDPPWTIRQTLPYGTLTDNEFCKLNLGELQSSGDLLFLWTTGRVIDHARKCLASWGYRDVEELIWVKVNQLQRPVVSGRTGHWSCLPRILYTIC